MCKNDRRGNYTRQMEFDKNSAINGTVAAPSILQYWDWFIVGSHNPNGERRSEGRQEKKRGTSRLVSSRRDGPLFSMRVRNLASSSVLVERNGERIIYASLLLWM